MMEIVIKISEDVYTRLFDKGIQDNEIAIDDICEIARALRLGKPLKEWLSSFNTDSATECFTAVQRLKESLNDRLDEGYKG